MLRDSSYREKFAEELEEGSGLVIEAASVNDKWEAMKDRWRSAAEKVVGWTKGKPRHRETWWWNERVGLAVEKKKKAFKYWSRNKCIENLEAYKFAKKEVRREVVVAKANKSQEIIDGGMLDENRANTFKVAKRLAKRKAGYRRVKCLRDG